MRLHDVDLPQAVIDAQKRSELVLFAGAGVSIDAPSNYPNFSDLATELGGTTYPIRDHELIDRYLGRLHEAELPGRAPALTARFLTALLSQEDGHNLWDLDQVQAMVSQLIDLDPTEPALRPLCEQLGRLGSPRALEFQGRLRS